MREIHNFIELKLRLTKAIKNQNLEDIIINIIDDMKLLLFNFLKFLIIYQKPVCILYNISDSGLSENSYNSKVNQLNQSNHNNYPKQSFQELRSQTENIKANFSILIENLNGFNINKIRLELKVINTYTSNCVFSNTRDIEIGIHEEKITKKIQINFKIEKNPKETQKFKLFGKIYYLYKDSYKFDLFNIFEDL